MVLFPRLSESLAAADAANHGSVPARGARTNAGYIPHPRATSTQLEDAVRDLQPSPEVLAPLLPRPHPRAALMVSALPPASDAIPHNHPLRRSAMTRILVWQVSVYTRDVHMNYQQWELFESDQCLASPYLFMTQEMARRFLAMRRIAKLPDTPPVERGSLGEVHWSASAIASITPDTLKPFGA